jgi:uncharacterized membrane protein
MRNLPSLPSLWIILGPVLVLGSVSLLLLLLAKGNPKPPETGWNGIFYSNPDDPALFVPKRYGIGYTLNFGNPWSWAVLILIFALVALPIAISASFLHRLPR